MIGIPMRSVELLRVGLKGIQARIRAKVDGPAAVFRTREISRICVIEDPPAQRDKMQFSHGKQPGCC
jgi:hypothetical protein